MKQSLIAYVAIALLVLPHFVTATPLRPDAVPPIVSPGTVVRTNRGQLAAYAARPRDVTAAHHPLVVYLHGLCGDALSGCRYLRVAAPEVATVVCPSAPVDCGNGGASWAVPARRERAIIEHSLTRAAQWVPEVSEADAPAVLVGYSQGAYAALNVLRIWPGRFRAVVLVAAYIHVTARELRAAGIQRVVFAASGNDGTHQSLVALTQTLARDGVEARYVDLGQQGHVFVHHNGPMAWREALVWAMDSGALVQPQS